ncbi:amino acid adenylation domain-containing protein [Oscillatoria sp. CS-180]|uniref:non-ribosomal peptide synthetase n=1 Tax=Oscillatoria sp. CS-180 TaxID=3021720 RepID=UPI002330D1A2|nr:non-ribosomal peptide synthetase [Oscillatoria sp. CS-180]MDB9524394.1 amino acid adenylation domain-containing protein [Oscillatoria sp. CS-180]
MTNLFQKLSALSPEQRALFEQKLAERGLQAPQQVTIPQRPSTEHPPLSFAQQRLWFIQQLDPTNTAYNVASVLRLRGNLNIPVLEQTLNALVERHETLRTHFDTTADNQPVQIVQPMQPVSLPVITLRQPEGRRLDRATANPTPPLTESKDAAQTIDFNAISPDRDELDNAAHEQITALTQKPFDLTQPLLRLALLQLNEQEHLLVLTTHHIISDRWSVMVFLREMTLLYDAFRQGKPSPLASLPIQYGDWALWQRQQLQGQRLEDRLTYWQEQLGGELPVLELAYDRPRPAVPTYQGAQQPLTLSPELSTALKTLSAQSNVTLFTLLLTAFKVLLHRYSQQHDIVVGSDIANRDRLETEGLIGLLVNTLVLRSDLSGDPRFCDLLDQVRETVLGALAHQDLPFEKLVEVLNPDRHLSQMMPLFQVKLDLQQARVRPLELAGITLERYPLADESAKYELRFNLQETEQGISGQVEYSTDLFDASTIARMVEHFQIVLTGIVAEPNQRLSELPLLGEAERNTLLTVWNQTQQPVPDDLCIHHLFEAQCDRTPDATALIWQEQHLTYRELNDQANRLAAYLKSWGVGPEVPVGICMNRSADMVVGLLGILKAGGAYVPLDPAYPTERLAFIVADAQISVLLTDGIVPFELGDRPLKVINPSVTIRDAGWVGSAHPTTHPTSDSLAYVIYTSGSTGRPKGVAIEHRNTVAMLHWAKGQFKEADLAGVLASTSICFDLSVFELFVPLSWGGCVILAENALALPKLPASDSVTLVNTVPSILTELLTINGLPSSVQTVNLAGEALPPALVQALRQLLHVQHVYNLYGPSEDTTYSTWANVTDLDTTAPRAPIGHPITNTQAYVLDPAGNPVPIGVPGELYLSGAGVARGYLNRPDLTAERFVPNPFVETAERTTYNEQPITNNPQPTTNPQPSTLNHPPILYKTGDRARYRSDGSLDYLGRIDYQVKLRGFRIELGEIEAVLIQHPNISQCIVVLREDNGQEPQLIAYVVKSEVRSQESEDFTNQERITNNQQQTTIPALKTHLSNHLPPYMVPTHLIELETLPRLPNGKIDRRSLPEPDSLQQAKSAPFIAPQTRIEQVLADIWRRELKLEQVSVHANFFELGGHSLLGMRMMAQAAQVLERDIPLKALFQTPTIAGLAAHIETTHYQTSASTRLPTLELDPESRDKPFPLTDIQQAYWLGRSQAFELGNVATHGYREIETIGLSVAQVETALRSLIQRHPMLRAVITSAGQQQIVPEVPPYEVQVTDLRDTAPEQVETALMAMRDRLSHAIHDVERWPLFTIEAAQLTAERIRFYVGFDVLIGDAWSFQLLGWEMAQVLQAQALSPLNLTFRDYVLAEQAFRQSPEFQQALDYWQQRLPDLPPAPDLPLAIAPSALERPRFERRSGRLDSAAWIRLQQRASQAGLTPSGVLLAAFSEVLATWSRQPRFTLNLTLFNRLPLHPQVNQIVGDFTSSLLLAVDNAGHDSFTVRARRLQAQLWEDLEHRTVSGVRVLRELAKTQPRPGGALMPVVFTSTLNQQVRQSSDRPWQADVVYGLSQTSQVYLDHQVSEVEGALVFNWDAIADLFPAGLLEDMFAAYNQFLQHLANTETAWKTLPQLSPTAHVEALNATATQLFSGTEPLLHQLFLEQAQQQPDQPAVIASDRTLTYNNLHHHVLSLAAQLHQQGVQPNQLIAVSMTKGWESVVAVLGILTAGAAYVPIAPDLPQERRWHLIRETQTTLLITQSELAPLAWPDSLTAITVEESPTFCLISPPSFPQPAPTDLAYVIYTSGSTGLPKGVMIDHRGTVNTVLDINQRFDVGTGDRVLALSALSFDLSVYDIFGTLAAGATLVIPEAQRDRDPAHWVDLLNAHNITLWNSVPALMSLFLTELERHPNPAQSLRQVLLSGDWLPLSLPEQIQAAFPNAEVVSLGGATEASIWSIAYLIQIVDSAWNSIPYGRPLANQQWYVLNGNLQPCPVWVPGQLYIGGKGLAQGYWQQPEKTAAAFVPNPLLDKKPETPINPQRITHNEQRTTHNPQPILYKTGDLGRYRPDGTIEFLGREDSQVKLNGYRVELGEIEAALLLHPAIREAVVMAVGETVQSQQLVAYVVPKEGNESAAGTTPNHPLAKLAFKQERRGLRRFADEPISVALPLDEANPHPYLRRQSYRQFRQTPIALKPFSQFLSTLKSIALAESPLPKYRYASAGSLYPVQTYLHVKAERIQGLEAGFYYYHPADHRLVQLETQNVDFDALYSSNPAIVEQSAFTLFFVGRMAAIAPIYAHQARDFCLLEAGYMSQLLMEAAPDHNLGLCPLGQFGLETLQQALDLDSGHEILHGLAGGSIDPAWTQQWQAPQESRSGTSLTAALRDFLAQKLPAYMVPTLYQLLEALPLSANGKVDRKALPMPSSLTPEQPFVAPSTEVEEAIAAIWQDVLQLEQVSIHANFFEVGGNSLAAMQALSQLRQAFPIDLSIRQFFTAQTLAEQAAVVESLLAGQSSPVPADTIQPIQPTDPQALLSQLDDLSEQDVDSLLSQMLEEES